MKSSINIVVPILFMHKETVVFISFCSEDHIYRNVVFLVTCFSATLPTPTNRTYSIKTTYFKRLSNQTKQGDQIGHLQTLLRV